MYKAGDTPGNGQYKCTNCGKIQEIKDNEALKPCSRCGHKEFEKQ